MKKAWHKVGSLAFWILWIPLFVYLYKSSRTRVLVISEGDVLVVRGWLGAGDWSLPGGGLHRGEDPAVGAVRELQEETGIKVAPKDLHFLFEKRSDNNRGHVFGIKAFVLELSKKPEISRQRMEITHLAWIPWDELYADKSITRDLRAVMDAFSQKK